MDLEGKPIMPIRPPISEEKKAQRQSTFLKILKNIRIQVHNIHIRFEDDYFASEKPYAFGFLCEV